MRARLKHFLRMCGHALAGAVDGRLEGLELRLDDLRAHSNQVEAKVDYLISLFEDERHQLKSEFHDLSSRVRDLSCSAEDLKCRTEHLAEDHSALLEGAIHTVTLITRSQVDAEGLKK